MKKFDVVSIGSSLRDIFILTKDLTCSLDSCQPFDPRLVGDKIGVEHMYFDTGGGGSNTAATFARLGLKTALLTKVGNDLAGQEIIRQAVDFGAAPDFILIDKKNTTGYSIIFIDQKGERTAFVFRGASDFQGLSALPLTGLKSSWFFITSLNGNFSLLKKIFFFAQKNKVNIAWNPGAKELSAGTASLKDYLLRTKAVFLNLKEAEGLLSSVASGAPALLSGLAALSATTIWCLTAGQKGAWLKKDNQMLHAGVLSKKVVNTTGAGDAFGAAFVSGLIIYKNDLKKALQLAILNSNSVVGTMGAKHGLLKKRPGDSDLARVKVS